MISLRELSAESPIKQLREFVKQEGLSAKATSKAELYERILTELSVPVTLETLHNSDSDVGGTGAVAAIRLSDLSAESSIKLLRGFVKQEGLNARGSSKAILYERILQEFGGPHTPPRRPSSMPSEDPPRPHTKRTDTFALVIGASQLADEAHIRIAEQAGVNMRHARYIPRRLFRDSNALPDVLGDVVAVKELLKMSNVPVTQFVGRDDTESLTKVGFLNKVGRLLEQPGKVFILYYSGHGTDENSCEVKPGGFCMKKGGFVTLDDLIDAWVGVCALDRRGQRFVIVADSCFSGALVDQLKAEHRLREREGLPPLNMAVQSASRAHETSLDGFFTKKWLESNQTGREFDLSDAVPNPRMCRTCEYYYCPGCEECEYFHHSLNWPRDLNDVQHPDYFCTWRDTGIDINGSRLDFYRR